VFAPPWWWFLFAEQSVLGSVHAPAPWVIALQREKRQLCFGKRITAPATVPLIITTIIGAPEAPAARLHAQRHEKHRAEDRHPQGLVVDGGPDVVLLAEEVLRGGGQLALAQGVRPGAGTHHGHAPVTQRHVDVLQRGVVDAQVAVHLVWCGVVLCGVVRCCVLWWGVVCGVVVCDMVGVQGAWRVRMSRIDQCWNVKSTLNRQERYIAL
jgi:hypothetical protein